MKSALLLALIAAGGTALAGPTNSILFVTQVQIPNDLTTIGSVFGNHRPNPISCGRGGDLYIRYPNGTVRNLTRAAGYGVYGTQHTNGIAVRQPSMHWSGRKAVFSMVVGAPKYEFDYTTTYFWQLYEITNFTDMASVPVITKVSNQPANYNNVSPVYGTDDRIIFSSDRPHNGQTNLYPQLDEFIDSPIVTGLWSLRPADGDLFLLNHAPSGAFSPILDSAGRVIFIRWDHLQRDQQVDIDFLNGYVTYGCFNWSDESYASVPTKDQTEVFPEPRSQRPDLLAGTGLAGHSFDELFPWQMNEDGTAEETLNHIGRHEIGGSFCSATFTNDPNLQALTYFGNHFNTNIVNNFLQISEDPNVPGLFYGIDAPELGTHAAGQLVSLTGATNINAAYMRLTYLTPRSTHTYAASPSTVPYDHTGFYRNPLMTTDGYLIASHTACTLMETGGVSYLYPTTTYDFRLKVLQLIDGYYVPGTMLTSGLTNRAVYWDPDNLITQTNFLWELDPVEVVARARPARLQEDLQAPELAAFEAAGVDVNVFRRYLRTHWLALIVSRDLTTRDHADRLQPFNLRIANTTHETKGAQGFIYDIAWLQIFQADLLRGLNYGDDTSPADGRRAIAQYLHDPAVDNPIPPAAPEASAELGLDGSMAAIVPARRAVCWQLTDPGGTGIVRERYWITFQPGEIRTCTSCHGINTVDQANHPAPTNTPSALIDLLQYWQATTAVQAQVTNNQGANQFQISFVHRPAESSVTYHVQVSNNLTNWSEIASYSGSNSLVSAQAIELSKSGWPNETVTIADGVDTDSLTRRFMRVSVTRP